MKRFSALSLAVILILSLFSGCGKEEKEAYVPTGDALIMSDDDLATIEAEQGLGLQLRFHGGKVCIAFDQGITGGHIGLLFLFSAAGKQGKDQDHRKRKC